MSSKSGNTDGKPKAAKRKAQPKQADDEEPLVHWTPWESQVVETPAKRIKRGKAEFIVTHTELCARCELVHNLRTPHAPNCKQIRSPPLAFWICQRCAPKMSCPPDQQNSTTYSNVQSVFQTNEEVGTPLVATTNESIVENEEGNFLLGQVQEDLDSEILMSEGGPRAEI